MTPGQHLTLGQVVELNKRFIESYLKFKDEPKIQKLRSDVLKYNRILRDLGLRDHQVSIRPRYLMVFYPTRIAPRSLLHGKPDGRPSVFSCTAFSSCLYGVSWRCLV